MQDQQNWGVGVGGWVEGLGTNNDGLFTEKYLQILFGIAFDIQTAEP